MQAWAHAIFVDCLNSPSQKNTVNIHAFTLEYKMIMNSSTT